MKTLPVFFSIDDNYAPWLAVALNSLISNASRDYQYDIVILHEGLKEQNMDKLKALSKPGFDIRFQAINERFECIRTDFDGNKLHTIDKFTLTIFFRLFLADMFPQYDKGIYIDSDIVLAGDIAELYNTPLEGNLIAACPDFSIQEIPPFISYVTEYVGVDKSLDYINSGILVMDLKQLREVGMGKRFLEVLGKWQFYSIAPDQDYINAMCKGRIKYLDKCWNTMPNENHPPLDNPKLIHYNLFSKPWKKDGVQYEDLFWKYAADCGFIEEINAYKKSFTDEDRAREDARGGSMVETALKVLASDKPSFRYVFNNGLEQRL